MSTIVVEGLSKMYRLARAPGTSGAAQRSVGGRIGRLLTAPVRRFRELGEHGGDLDAFWALRDVSFSVERGEVVGIVGRNGAGKSTLLKILSRVVEPTEGRAMLRGRVASLLEVGTGFHPELTGRENIYLNGSILGMRRAEIARKFDEIAAFAEVERFLDTPVKRYSSGMYVRLAFAVAAHLEPEILIVDEVLAVGDQEFQRKCLGKMQDVARGAGRTVLFVSHNMAAVRQLCSRGVLLAGGKLQTVGSASDVVDAYAATFEHARAGSWERPAHLPRGPLVFEKASAQVTGRQPDLTLNLELDVAASEAHRSCSVAVDVCDSMGTAFMQAIPSLEPFIHSGPQRQRVRVAVELPPLVPGLYSVTLWVGPHNTETYDLVRECLTFEVADTPHVGRTFPHSADHGFIVPPSTCSVER
jgi:lipopolysaccharide transport system ATP-binding protein